MAAASSQISGALQIQLPGVSEHTPSDKPVETISLSVLRGHPGLLTCSTPSSDRMRSDGEETGGVYLRSECR